MNEQQIFQSMSMMVFNAINRGVPKDAALKEAEETMRLLIEKARGLAKLAVPEANDASEK